MRSLFPRRQFVGCMICVLLAARLASAEIDFPVEIDAIEGRLPPQGIVRRMCGAAEVLSAAASEAGLKVLASQNDKVRVRDEQGTEVWVHLVLTFPESIQPAQSQSTYWGLVHAQPLSESGGSLNPDQAVQYEPIVRRVADAWVGRMEATLSGFAAEPIQRRLLREKTSWDQNARQVAEANARIEHTQAELQSLATAAVPTAVIERQLSEALTQQQTLDVELAGLEARKHAVEEQVATVAKMVDDKTRANSELATNLGNKIALLAKSYEQIHSMVLAGQGDQSDLDQVSRELDVAREELAAVTQAKPHDIEPLLAKLHVDLADAVILTTVSKAKKDFVANIAGETTKLLQIETQQAQPLREELAKLQRQLVVLETERFELSRGILLSGAESRPVRVRKLVPEPGENEKPNTSP